jgi:hypothetical protein
MAGLPWPNEVLSLATEMLNHHRYHAEALRGLGGHDDEVDLLDCQIEDWASRLANLKDQRSTCGRV